jgi:cyclopropane-fatty-acyl-phospholipid synthase
MLQSTLASARLVMDALVGPTSERDFAVRFWDGTTDSASPDTAVPFTLVLRSPRALRRACWPPSELRLGEAFTRGDIDVEGDLEEAAGLLDLMRARLSSPWRVATLLRRALALPDIDTEAPPPAAHNGHGPEHNGRRHSRARDQAAVRFHYDVGNEFYALWLDRAMLYSCAYFDVGDETIDAAQQAKLDHICRKLRLQPGERLLDIGCGWGALVRHAARCYGVTATGITLSPQQAALARDRIDAEGLTGQCTVEVMDYRDVPARQFDKIVSVGMVEHVGRARLGAYFQKAYSLLAPGGLFLNHSIIALSGFASGPRAWMRRTLWRQGAFMDRYVFPDGEVLPLHVATRHAEQAGFETRDVESLREHYVLTLRRWVRRLAERQREAIRIVGADTYRIWCLYMAASARAFATGRIGLAQTLFAKPDRDGRVDLPLTRGDLYDLAMAGGGRSVSRKFH